MNSLAKNLLYSATATATCIAITHTYDKKNLSNNTTTSQAETITRPSELVLASSLASPARTACAWAITATPITQLPTRALSSIGPTSVISSIESLTTSLTVKHFPNLEKNSQTLLGSCIATTITLPADVWSIITSQKNPALPFTATKQITLNNLPKLFTIASLRNGIWLGIAMTQREKMNDIANKYSNNNPIAFESIKIGLTMGGAIPAGILHVGLCSTVKSAYESENSHVSMKDIVKHTAKVLKKPIGVAAVSMRCLHAGIYSLTLGQIERHDLFNFNDTK